MPLPPSASPTTDALAPAQWLGLIAIGAVLWILVILLFRAVDSIGGFAGLGPALFYALLVPGTVPLITATRRIVRLRRAQTLLAVAVVTASASLLDGTALAVIPAFYGTHPLAASATLLWGVGVALSLAVWMGRARLGG
ncbi:hypothetical protein QH494_26190 [Sphingomonas sp. AR_OL41]|jgi:hypothetical protein|uniref:hypothetical protein n=1 Tax=Sphingomonas sp. AR_OL41 TaxID=3042729 RepID=UPI00248066AD|nr:hypothetical protein [Sphingomonas sp. AR_OL41]MDH7975691.1 hypothetical protein [Sphingomonas sp. AR_OL41]